MKRILSVSVLFILLANGVSAQQAEPLDKVVKSAARGVEEVLSQGTKVAVINFASPSTAFSDYVIEELTGELVTGRKVTIVDRRNLALVSAEMNLQMSGEVSDESAQAVGKMLGAQSIVSGTLTNMGTYYRFRIKVINVGTAAIQAQVSFDLRNDAQVAFLLGSGSANTQSASSSGTASGGSTTTETPMPIIEGTIVPGANLTAKLEWLKRSADSHNTYILAVNADENIAPYTFEYKDGIDITIVLRGDVTNRTIKLKSNGIMFTVKSNVTLILDNNITLRGHAGNNAPLVVVDGGTLRMRPGVTITGNTNTRGNGGGVSLCYYQFCDSATFEMLGGSITGNTATSGGGVYVGNTAISKGTFIMTGGTISGNTATKGGGVYTHTASITIRGGTITGNVAREYGGGVYLNHQWATFNKSGGTITGYGSDPNNGNVVKDDANNILARRGHAVFVNYSSASSIKRKETTAGTGVNLTSVANKTPTGSWDN